MQCIIILTWFNIKQNFINILNIVQISKYLIVTNHNNCMLNLSNKMLH